MAASPPPTLSPDNHLYLYGLLASQLGCGKQTFITHVEEALASDRMTAEDLGFESTRALLEALDDFIELRVFKGGRVYATIVAQPAWDTILAAQAEERASAKPTRKRGRGKAVKPVRPRRVKRTVSEIETKPDAETVPVEEPLPAGSSDLEAQQGQDEQDAPHPAAETARVRSETQATADHAGEEAAATGRDPAEGPAGAPGSTPGPPVPDHSGAPTVPTAQALKTGHEPTGAGTEEEQSAPTQGQIGVEGNREPEPEGSGREEPADGAEDARGAVESASQQSAAESPARPPQKAETPAPAPKQAPTAASSMHLTVTYDPGDGPAPAHARPGTTPDPNESPQPRNSRPQAPAHRKPQSRRAQTTPAPPAPAPEASPDTPPSARALNEYPHDLATEVYIPGALEGLLATVLPYGTSPSRALAQAYAVAREEGGLLGNRSQCAFSLALEERPLACTALLKRTGQGGFSWALASLTFESAQR